MMTLKDIRGKIWNIALKLSEFSCSCGWECGECRVYGNHADTHTIEPSIENEGHESKEVMM